jgi:hypothetical protein
MDRHRATLAQVAADTVQNGGPGRFTIHDEGRYDSIQPRWDI